MLPALILHGEIRVHLHGVYAFVFTEGVLTRAVAFPKTRDSAAFVICGEGSIGLPDGCTGEAPECTGRIAVPPFTTLIDNVDMLEEAVDLPADLQCP
eukprot:m.295533 g.295533  ORF g.295533 m.295533 type:complete len:97 (-) comp55154_c0_seq13:132-422(-)